MAQIAYILAASHSGSTLLALLLGAHRETCTVGELKATALGDTDKYRCSCGELIKHCGFWADVSRRMARRGIPFDITDAGTDFRSCPTAYTRRLLRPLHRGRLTERARDLALEFSPRWRAGLPRIQQRNAALVETVSEITGKRIVVDSSKDGLRLKYLMKNKALDVKVIRLIRDGRAVALTYMDPLKFASGGRLRVRPRLVKPQMSMEQAAYQWRRSNEEADHLLANLDPSRVLELRYEEYCIYHDAALQKAFSFLGLDPAGAIPEFRSLDHHVVGNMMRLDSTSAVAIDERWRAVLKTDEVAAFHRVAGRLNRQYGYE